MSPTLCQERSRIAGFTLVEMLVATLLMGIVLASLATITAQWLPNWNRGFVRVQRAQLLAIAVERLVADIAAAEFVTPHRQTDRPLFVGTDSSVILVRTSLGPNTRAGLDIVRISEMAGDRGTLLVRSRTGFAPGNGSPDQLNFDDPVVLLRSPYRVSFAYAGKDGMWKDSWRDASALPSAVRLTVRDTAGERTLPISTVAVVHASLPAECASANSDCDEVEPEKPVRSRGER
jgi:general secretion pathway protein J